MMRYITHPPLLATSILQSGQVDPPPPMPRLSAYVLLCGNPIDGFQFVGPFESHDDATDYAGKEGHDEWWVAELEAPEDSHEG